MEKVNWKRAEGGTTFCLEGETVLWIQMPEGTRDEFVWEDGGAIRWERRTDVKTSHMVMEAKTLFSPVHTMIPAISYDGNPWGKDHEYKGLEENGTAWSFAPHRCAVPGASCSWNGTAGIALFSQGLCSCSLSKDEEGEQYIHRLIWPETEGPKVLYGDSWQDAYQGSMDETDHFTAWICIGDGSNVKRQLLHAAWKLSWHGKKPQRDAQEIWKLSASYARLLYTEEEDGFCAFSIGFKWNGKEWVKRPDYKYEIGWCGQNASLAVSLMKDYEKTGEEASLRMAVRVLDSWVRQARSDKGLLLTRYDPDDSLIDACNLGTAGQQFFEAYETAQALGMDKKAWLDAAFEICDFVLERMKPDGSIGMSWNRDGSIHEEKGTAGAFLVLPLAEAYLRTGQERYLKAAKKGHAYYYGEFAACGYGTSGALDTCCIDKESVIPLLKGALLLYEATKEPVYLEQAEDAAWYLSTWQWHQTVNYPADTILGEMGYDTFGGTAVSTAHQHLDPFALCYIPQLFSLAEWTGNREWKERAVAIWRNAAQGISDGTLRIRPTGVRPEGSCDEGILHTRWGYNLPNATDGVTIFGVSQWLVAWPCAFRLEVLRKCGNWKVLDEWGLE